VKAAFTLIEVLIAVVIASIAGMAIFQMRSNNLFLLKKLADTQNMAYLSTIAANHMEKRYNHTTKPLYDLLASDYDLKNDSIRRYLKSLKFTYLQESIETISFGEEKNVSEDIQSEEKAPSADQLIVNRLLLKENSRTFQIYTIAPALGGNERK